MAEKTICTICDTVLKIRICMSAAGWYLGYICPKDGPYDRVSDYYGSEEEAKAVLTLARIGGRL